MDASAATEKRSSRPSMQTRRGDTLETQKGARLYGMPVDSIEQFSRMRELR